MKSLILAMACLSVCSISSANCDSMIDLYECTPKGETYKNYRQILKDQSGQLKIRSIEDHELEDLENFEEGPENTLTVDGEIRRTEHKEDGRVEAVYYGVAKCESDTIKGVNNAFQDFGVEHGIYHVGAKTTVKKTSTGLEFSITEGHAHGFQIKASQRDAKGFPIESTFLTEDGSIQEGIKISFPEDIEDHFETCVPYQLSK